MLVKAKADLARYEEQLQLSNNVLQQAKQQFDQATVSINQLTGAITVLKDLIATGEAPAQVEPVAPVAPEAPEQINESEVTQDIHIVENEENQ